jgi:hypothetical protein
MGKSILIPGVVQDCWERASVVKVADSLPAKVSVTPPCKAGKWVAPHDLC